MKGSSVAKVQMNMGSTKYAGMGPEVKYDRKYGLASHTVTESKAAPAA